MNNIQLGLAGHFTLTVSGGKRGTVVLADFDNMILDAGLNRVASGGVNNTDYCQVGTGTTPVTASDTALVSAVASTFSITRNWGAGTYVAGPPAYKTDFKTYRFGTGVAAGNLTEVGVGWASSGGLFSRALIVDGGGSPTTITVLSDETLDVTYTLRLYAPSDVASSVMLAGTSYSYTIRAANMGGSGLGSWNPGDLMAYGMATAPLVTGVVYTGAISSTPSGTPGGSSAGATINATPAGYVANSMQRAVEYKIDLSQGNIGGGIRSLQFYVSGDSNRETHCYQMEFSPNVPKDNTKVLRLNFTFSIARAP